MGFNIFLIMIIFLSFIMFTFILKNYNKKHYDEMIKLMRYIVDKVEDPDIAYEIRDGYDELVTELKKQEQELYDSVEEINSYKKELNVTYKSLLAKSTELEYSNSVLEKRVANLSNLNAVGKSVLSELDLEKIISIIMDAYFVLTGVQKIAIYLWEDGKLVNKAFKGNLKEVRDYKYEKELIQDYDLIYKNISREIIEEDEVVIYSNLNVKGKELGVIYLIHNEDRGESERETVKALAMHVAIAMNNSKMYSELAVKERLGKEISIASNIQKNLLPKEIKIPFVLDRSEYFEPAKEIGGDYYDYNVIDSNRLFITIGDVSGKGVPASLLMTTIRATLKTLCHTDDNVQNILTNLNNFVCSDMSEEMFVTIFHSLYDNKTQTLYYSNAGHNPLLVYKVKEDRVVEEIVKGTAIGFLEDYKYKLGRLELQKGDILVYYTDGITEAENSEKDLYGKERLKAVLEESSSLDAESIKKSILRSVDSFREGYEQVDDITLLVIKI